MKVVITGGHFSPALSVIEELKDSASVHVIGRKYTFEGDRALSFEYKTCKKLDIPFSEITTGRLQRKLTFYTIPSLLKIPVGIFRAIAILKTQKPDLVLSFGGYIGVPVCIAAYLLGIDVVIHEQTQHAGIANRLIAKIAKKICITFPSSAVLFPASKVVLTGTPLRKEIFEINDTIPLPGDVPVIYITGGSAGSHAINEIVFSCIPTLIKKYIVIHQTGESKFKDFEKAISLKNGLADGSDRYIVKKFVDQSEIGFILKTADLVIGRAGMNTVLELLTLSKVCILIPLPHGQNQEQRENATLVRRIGIGEYIEQEHLTPDLLLETIDNVSLHKKEYLAHKSDAEKFVVKDAAKKLVDVIQSIYAQKTKSKVQDTERD